MTNEVHELTPAKRIKKPSYYLVYSWVKDVWKKVNPNLICKSFKYYGISVKTDGTEDDEIFDYNNLLIENKENFNENDGDNELLGEGEDGEDNYNNWDEF